jgi:hypothetical protein
MFMIEIDFKHALPPTDLMSRTSARQLMCSAVNLLPNFRPKNDPTQARPPVNSGEDVLNLYLLKQFLLVCCSHGTLTHQLSS